MRTIACTLAAAIAIAAAGCSEGGGGQSDDRGGSSPVSTPFGETSELRRSGSTLTLSFQLSMPGGEADSDGPDIEDTFDDGIGEYDAARGNDENSVDGISLVDTRNVKRHLVGRDATGTCVCDSNLFLEGVSPQAPTILSATFAAPPPDVRNMDVVVPRYGTFKDVPVQ